MTAAAAVAALRSELPNCGYLAPAAAQKIETGALSILETERLILVEESFRRYVVALEWTDAEFEELLTLKWKKTLPFELAEATRG